MNLRRCYDAVCTRAEAFAKAFPLVTRRRYLRDLAHLEEGWKKLLAGASNTRQTALAQAAQALAAETHRADHLQQRLDQALGLDSRPVALGAGWQDRRQKHMHLDKPAAAEEAS